MGSNHRLSWVCLVLLVASTTFTAASKQECNLLSQTTWSTQTREYCCLIEGLGCPSTSRTTSTTILRIHAPSSVAKIPGPDCYLGTPETWSLWKRNWCCESKGVHCSVELSVSRARETKIRYNCTDRMQLGEKGWSLAKHEYCCTQELLCPYNCQVGLSSWVTWSGGKKEWCCERETIACETHLLAMLNSKSVVTQIDTTIEPVETTLALPTSTTITTVTTATTVTRVTTTTHTITTITTTTSTTTTSTTTATTTIDFVSLRAYDCVSRPVPDWPSDRQLWCCKHAHIGCRSTQTDIYKIVLAASLVVMAALVLGLPLAALTFKNKSVERTITCVENYPVEDEHSYLEVSQSIHRGPNADAMEGHRNQTPLASPDSSTKQSADNGTYRLRETFYSWPFVGKDSVADQDATAVPACNAVDAERGDVSRSLLASALTSVDLDSARAALQDQVYLASQGAEGGPATPASANNTTRQEGNIGLRSPSRPEYAAVPPSILWPHIHH